MSDTEKKLSRYFHKQLRRFFYRSPVRSAVFARYKTAAGFLCLYCGQRFKDRKLLQVEHVKPAVPVDQAYVSAGERLIRMFDFQLIDGKLELSLENLVLSCETCHKGKSKGEMALRAKNKTGPYSAEAKAKAKATRERNKRRKK